MCVTSTPRPLKSGCAISTKFFFCHQLYLDNDKILGNSDATRWKESGTTSQFMEESHLLLLIFCLRAIIIHLEFYLLQQLVFPCLTEYYNGVFMHVLVRLISEEKWEFFM